MTALLRLGATARGEPQIARVAAPRTRMGPSIECADCHRYFSTAAVGETACKCGQRLVVTHDGEHEAGVLEGRRCMDCGNRWEMARREEGRSPRREENDRQICCALCSSMSPIGPKRGLRRLAAG